MIAIDTNLLVYAHVDSCPEQSAARRALEEAERSGVWGWSLPVTHEFWSVVTRPAIPACAQAARAFLAELCEAGAAVWYPQPGFADRLLAAAEAVGCFGARIFDLKIALIAADHGATEIWTHDQGFPSIAGLRVVDPIG